MDRVSMYLIREQPVNDAVGNGPPTATTTTGASKDPALTIEIGYRHEIGRSVLLNLLHTTGRHNILRNFAVDGERKLYFRIQTQTPSLPEEIVKYYTLFSLHEYSP